MESMARFKTEVKRAFVDEFASKLKSKELTQSEQRVLEDRHAFSIRYCEAKGWPGPPHVTDEQLEELRRQPEWAEALKWLRTN
jgi:hypothetical protein